MKVRVVDEQHQRRFRCGLGEPTQGLTVIRRQEGEGGEGGDDEMPTSLVVSCASCCMVEMSPVRGKMAQFLTLASPAVCKDGCTGAHGISSGERSRSPLTDP